MGVAEVCIVVGERRWDPRRCGSEGCPPVRQWAQCRKQLAGYRV